MKLLFAFFLIGLIPFPGDLSWNKTSHDFGNINNTDTLKTTFTCYNISNKEIAIENIQTSCGCVLTKWQSTPIQPSDSSKIEVRFVPSKKKGNQFKSVSVYTTSGFYELEIKTNYTK